MSLKFRYIIKCIDRNLHQNQINNMFFTTEQSNWSTNAPALPDKKSLEESLCYEAEFLFQLIPKLFGQINWTEMTEKQYLKQKYECSGKLNHGKFLVSMSNLPTDRV